MGNADTCAQHATLFATDLVERLRFGIRDLCPVFLGFGVPANCRLLIFEDFNSYENVYS
jgi:hypothetical protein